MAPAALAFQHCRQCPDREGCHALKQCAINAMNRTERGRQKVALAHLDGLAEAEGTIDALADGLAGGVTITLPEEPPEHARRLLSTLGATYEVKTPAKTATGRPGHRTEDAGVSAPPSDRRPERGPQQERSSEMDTTETDTTCVIEGCEEQQVGGRGPLKRRCHEHVREEMARRHSARQGRKEPEPEAPEPQEPEPIAAETNGAGPHSYADRARVVLEAAERLDKAQAEVEAARAEYDSAREALVG